MQIDALNCGGAALVEYCRGRHELCAAGESVGVYLHDGFLFLWYFYGKGSFFVGRA